MDLRDFMVAVADRYDIERNGGVGQQLLNQARDLLSGVAPPGFLVRSSRVIGGPTHTPWIGFFDPDETTDPKAGLYVCWLFNPGLAQVYLSIQQGTERLSHDGRGRILIRLARDADRLRAGLGIDQASMPFMDLGQGQRQRRYTAGSVSHLAFDVRNLPAEPELRQYLSKFLLLLQDAVAVRRELVVAEPTSLEQGATKSDVAAASATDPLAHFRPKSADDYVARLSAQIQVKTRRHEALVTAFAGFAASAGWSVATPHPIDLRLRGASPQVADIVVEAKTVRRGNSTQAVREAIGQLLTYQHVLLTPEERSTAKLMALFDEPIGDCWGDLLDSLGILSVSWDAGSWSGRQGAVSLGLTSTPVFPLALDQSASSPFSETLL